MLWSLEMITPTRLLGLALIASLCACEKEKVAAPPVDPFIADMAAWEESLARLDAAQAEQGRRLEALTEPGPTAVRVREGLSVERELLLQLKKALATARDLTARAGDPMAAQAAARARVSSALETATRARSQNEALWVNLQAQLSKRAVEPEKKPEAVIKKEE